MKISRFVMLILAFIVLPVHANNSGWYTGAGLGYTKFHYDLNREVNDFLRENNYLPYVTLLDYIGSPLSVSQDFDSYSNNIFVGYKFNNTWSVQLGYKKFSVFTAQANIPPLTMTETFNGSVGASYPGLIVPSVPYLPPIPALPPIDVNATITGTVYASGSASASASVKAESLAISVLFSPYENSFSAPYLKVGLDYTKATLTSNVTYNYNYGYNLNVDGTQYADNVSETYNETKIQQLRGFIPSYGIGVDFFLTKNITLRTEYERVGIPETNVDAISVNIMYQF